MGIVEMNVGPYLKHLASPIRWYPCFWSQGHFKVIKGHFSYFIFIYIKFVRNNWNLRTPSVRGRSNGTIVFGLKVIWRSLKVISRSFLVVFMQISSLSTRFPLRLTFSFSKRKMFFSHTGHSFRVTDFYFWIYSPCGWEKRFFI